MSDRSSWIAVVLLFAVLGGLAVAQEEAATPEPEPEAGIEAEAEEAVAETDASSVRLRLDAVREDLVQLRLEKALAALDELLAGSPLSEAERTEAWILKSQAHVAFGDLNAAEEDYREILRRRPGFRPESSLTTPKAMQRFERVADLMVGVLKIDLSPADARLLVDGEEVVRSADGSVAVLAGERALRAERRGYDAFEQVYDVAPGAVSDITLQLVPNARTVIVRTRPAGVEVRVDGRLAGETVPTSERADDAALIVEDVPLGEHEFELSKPCFRTRITSEFLSVDVMDPSPLQMELVAMVPSRAFLAASGVPSGAAVLVDGEPVGSLPLEGAEVCPGQRRFEVEAEGRKIFAVAREIREGETASLNVRPRPNVVVLGASEWPRGFETFAATVNTLEYRESADVTALDRLESWPGVGLPADTHLAVAVLPPLDEGAPERWFLYSPLLERMDRLDAPLGAAEPPVWETNDLGWALSESRSRGVVVVRVDPDGPAAAAGVAPGDRIVRVGGDTVARVEDGVSRVAASPPGSTMAVEVGKPNGETRTVEIAGRASPRLVPLANRPGEASILAAWAEQEAAALPDRAADRLANLAVLLTRQGRDDIAAEMWRRVRWGQGDAVGEGTAAYYLGLALLRSGEEEGALGWFRKAAASDARAWTDDAPRIAPAAEDHLADLGVTVE